ncbi:MAG: hypothetical protein F6K22_23160 [Okeania sp. SIO2F4]|uniref:hypothetical protein n=1 Tax=Okeania sp. SIO2F4 TaxID=2607790 RepID=UPI00142B7218|nr:hypothetical protein [Okeania sp. SIO2F4]NES05457.1 hypothetical protein [Okeania sp. SIO2F4]
MPFSNYKNIGAVAKEYQIKCISANFINELEFPAPQHFREELEFLLSHGTIYGSEYAICENLIYPILKEVWKSYYQKLTLWSHETLTYDEKLSGQPDYIVTKLSPLGRIIFDKPYFLVVEAKQDKFVEGWGQCLAELVAAQKINNDLEQTIFGIVSNGQVWQFGKLKGDVFTRNIASYSIEYLDKLFAVVNYVFQQCLLQLEKSEKNL